MPSLFISYRRSDAQAEARLIARELGRRFPAGSVLLDERSIPGGVDFRDHIASAIRRCDIVLVLIGHAWLNAEKNGRRRLDDPEDLVRVEIESALAAGRHVIPLPLNGAAMPAYSDLPVSLGPLAYKNALTFDAATDSAPQIARLVTAIQDHRLPQRTIRALSRGFLISGVVAVGLAVAALALWREVQHRRTPAGFFEHLAELDPAVFESGGPGESPAVARAFADRLALDKTRALKDQIGGARASFDIFLLSGKSLADGETNLIEAVQRGVAVRVLLVDHGAGNEASLQHYMEMVPKSDRDLDWYRANYASTLGLLRRVRAAAGPDRTSGAGRFEVRVFPGPFINSFWVRDPDRPETAAGHVSVTAYGDDRQFLSVRVGRLSQDAVRRLWEQFEAMWREAKPMP